MRSLFAVSMLALVGCGTPAHSLDAASAFDAPEAALDARDPSDAPEAALDAPDPIDVLAFTRTTGFRHGSIEAAVAALTVIATERAWRLERTEDPARLGDLFGVEVLVFLSTTGDVVGPAEETEIERFVREGGGWVGIHAASDTEYDWPFYATLVGAYFDRHPAIQPATIRVEQAMHPATSHLTDPWMRTDEWYDFRASPRGAVDVLLTLDESSYTGGEMGADHPIAWSHTIDAGRAFYTGLGHTDEAWSEPAFLDHVEGAITWAARLD